MKPHSFPQTTLIHSLISHSWPILGLMVLLPPTPTYPKAELFQGSQGPCLLYLEPWLTSRMGWEIGISSVRGGDLLDEAEAYCRGPDIAGLSRVACKLVFGQKSQIAKDTSVVC